MITQKKNILLIKQSITPWKLLGIMKYLTRKRNLSLQNNY